MRISTLHASVQERASEEGERWAEVTLWFGDAYVCTFRTEDWYELCVSPDRDLVLDEFVAEKMRTLLRAPS